ncbi:MAG: type II CAAX endopeptidase family protein [Bryobacteraceae bacterium]
MMPEDATPESPGIPFWTYQDLIIFLGLALPSLLAGAMLVRGAMRVFGWSTAHKALELLPGQFAGYAILFGALWVLFRLQYGRSVWSAMRLVRAPLPWVTIFLLGSLLAIGIAVLGALLRTPDGPNPMKELLSDRTSLIVVSVAGSTLGPWFEEMAFRGLMQPLFIRSLGVAPGILLAGLGFGLVHLPQYGLSWRHALLITLAGASFGWMRHRTGSTAASTMMHSAYNLTLFLGFLASGKDVPKSW